MPMISDLKITTQGDRELVMTRTFDASRDLVFEALTRPDLLKQWLLGPDGWILAVCEVDLRANGKYYYRWQHKDGREMGMGGVFSEIQKPTRLVYTEAFDESWYPGHALMTATLTEDKGRTLYKVVSAYESKAALDQVLKTPMEKGVKASYDRLEALLQKQR